MPFRFSADYAGVRGTCRKRLAGTDREPFCLIGRQCFFQNGRVHLVAIVHGYNAVYSFVKGRLYEGFLYTVVGVLCKIDHAFFNVAGLYAESIACGLYGNEVGNRAAGACVAMSSLRIAHGVCQPMDYLIFDAHGAGAGVVRAHLAVCMAAASRSGTALVQMPPPGM